MRIGKREYSEIIVMDAENNLLASITDENIIEERNCIVRGIPVEKGE